jgi:hypothetical protein
MTQEGKRKGSTGLLLEVLLRVSLNSVPHGGEQSASCPALYTYPLDRRLCGHQSRPDMVARQHGGALLVLEERRR